MGRPVIFVPYGASLEGDQLYNATYLADRHACILMREYDFTMRNLTNVLNKLISDPEILIQLAKHIKALAVPNATERLIHILDQEMNYAIEDKKTRKQKK